MKTRTLAIAVLLLILAARQYPPNSSYFYIRKACPTGWGRGCVIVIPWRQPVGEKWR